MNLKAISTLILTGALCLTAAAKAQTDKAPKATVAKALGTPVHTPKNTNLYKGMNHVPQTSPDDEEERFGSKPIPIYNNSPDSSEVRGRRRHAPLDMDDSVRRASG